MRCTLPTLVGLLTLAAPLASQAKPGHVYVIGYYQALPGKGDEYNKALADVTIPVFNEMVKRNVIVSYLQLVQTAGSGEYTNVFVVEFANWAALDGSAAKLNDAAQATLHKSWSEASAGFPELRRTLRNEVFTASGQQR